MKKEYLFNAVAIFISIVSSFGVERLIEYRKELNEIKILETNLIHELEQNYYSLLSLRGTLNSVITVSDSITSNWKNIDSKKIILRQADISSSGDIINEEVAINYGFFIETFIDFMIVAFTIFIVIKFLNKLKIQAEDPSNNKVSTPRNIKLLTEINDSLKDLNKNLTKKN